VTEHLSLLVYQKPSPLYALVFFPLQKRDNGSGGEAKVVEHLPSKCEAPSSNPSICFF
jgi:hypothetical protein